MNLFEIFWVRIALIQSFKDFTIEECFFFLHLQWLIPITYIHYTLPAVTYYPNCRTDEFRMLSWVLGSYVCYLMGRKISQISKNSELIATYQKEISIHHLIITDYILFIIITIISDHTLMSTQASVSSLSYYWLKSCFSHLSLSYHCCQHFVIPKIRLLMKLKIWKPVNEEHQPTKNLMQMSEKLTSDLKRIFPA